MKLRSSLMRVFTILVTILYCLFVWYAIALWSTLSHFDQSPSFFTQFAIEPLQNVPIYLHAIHWQIAAILFLIYNFYSENRYEHNNTKNTERTLLLQVTWIMISIFIHLLGAMIPMISIGYMI